MIRFNNLNIVIGFILLSFLVRCERNDLLYNNELHKFNLYGRVKSYEYYEYGELGSGPKEIIEFPKKFKYTFDSVGNEIEYIVYHSKGNIKKKTLKEYDSKRNVVQITIYDSVDRIILKSVYKYDDRKNVVEKTSFNDKLELLISERFKYNQNYDLVERVICEKGNDIYKEMLSHDDHGNKVEQKFFNRNSNGQFDIEFKNSFNYDKDGKLIEWSRFKYDHKSKILKKLKRFDPEGNIIENTDYKTDGSVLRKIVTQYDNNNYKIQQLIYFGDSLKERVRYAYDPKGNLTEENHFWNEKGFSKKYQFDEKGNMIEFQSEILVHEKQIFSRYKMKYEYDHNDSWVKRKKYLNDNLLTITERKIEYYN